MFGTSLVVAPRLSAATWIGKSAAAPAVQVVARALGIRDAALGAATLAALGSDGPVRPWVLAALVSDAVDLTATLVAGDDISKSARIMISAMAGSAVVINAVAAGSVDDPPQA